MVSLLRRLILHPLHTISGSPRTTVDNTSTAITAATTPDDCKAYRPAPTHIKTPLDPDRETVPSLFLYQVL